MIGITERGDPAFNTSWIDKMDDGIKKNKQDSQGG